MHKGAWYWRYYLLYCNRCCRFCQGICTLSFCKTFQFILSVKFSIFIRSFNFIYQEIKSQDGVHVHYAQRHRWDCLRDTWCSKRLEILSRSQACVITWRQFGLQTWRKWHSKGCAWRKIHCQLHTFARQFGLHDKSSDKRGGRKILLRRSDGLVWCDCKLQQQLLCEQDR